MKASCPGCQATEWETLFTVARAPISCGQLFATRQAAASADQCRLEITLCHSCGHIWNLAHGGGSADTYNDDYYSSFVASPQGRLYQENVAGDLDRVAPVSGKTVLEIGCGDGHFLKMLSDLGARAIGFEPSSTFQIAANQPGIEVYSDHFSFDSTPNLETKVDLIVLRHVLEHLESPLQVLQSLQTGHSDIPAPQFLFLEVPNASRLLEDNLYFDFYNDHIHYFSRQSLARLSTSAGWLPMAWLEGREECLRLVCLNSSSVLEAPEVPGQNGDLVPGQEITSSATRFRQDLERWKRELTKIITECRESGRSIAVWGAGARGVALLSGLGLPGDAYEYIVDSDPGKHGKFLQMIEQPILSPEQLRRRPVDCVLVTSYTFFDEILGELDWFRSAGGEVIRVYPMPELV